MKIAYFPNQVALNGGQVLNSFLNGCKSLGIDTIPYSLEADAAVIWSVLWNGRMRQNRAVYEHYRNQNKPVFILEVGALRRQTTWKLSINNVNGQGIFANTENFIKDRENILNLHLSPWKTQRNAEILIAGQHHLSQQWVGMPSMTDWVSETVTTIRKYTNRPIIIRPHPRSSIRMHSIGNVIVDIPRKVSSQLDVYNLDYNFHCIVNHSSSVAVQSAIAGCPIITDINSLASPVSGNFENIENISYPTREKWFEEILHTEWLLEELAQGIPQRRLLDKI